jgi:hypothetical protein
MKLYRETRSARLEEVEYRMDLFAREVDAGDGELNMHGFFITNRNIIFGQYLYLLHETELSSESFIDFIAFTENGAVLLIEVKRGADSRNRQEVVSQLGKYAIDAFAINSLLDDEEALVKTMLDPKLQNKPIENSLLNRIRTNVQNNNLNLFLITEDATDEVLASVYYLSYGRRNQKISVIELKRFVAGGKRYCTVRQFNKQSLLNSTRKSGFELQTKLNLIEDARLKAEMERITGDWQENGFSVAPLTESTPEYFTFEWKKGQSSRIHFYIMNKNQKNLSGTIHKNSVAFYFELEELESFRRTIDWIEQQRNCYRLQTDNRGKSRDYHLYCIDISDYETDEIDAVFQRAKEVATVRRKLYMEE